MGKIRSSRNSKAKQQMLLRLMRKQRNKCWYCEKVPEFNQCTIDHKIPLGRGGSDKIYNLVMSCKPCNAGKGNMTEREFRNKIQQAQ